MEISTPLGNLLTWRQQLLGRILPVLVALGVPVVGLAIYYETFKGNLQRIPVFIGLYLVIVIVTFWKRVPYPYRLGTFLLLLYAMGIFVLKLYGMDGEIFLVAFTLMTLLFLGWRLGIFALVLSFLTMGSVPFLFLSGSMDDILIWTPSSVIFLMFGALLLSSLNLLMTRLLDSLQHFQGANEEIQKRAMVERSQNEKLQCPFLAGTMWLQMLQ